MTASRQYSIDLDSQDGGVKIIQKNELYADLYIWTLANNSNDYIRLKNMRSDELRELSNLILCFANSMDGDK